MWFITVALIDSSVNFFKSIGYEILITDWTEDGLSTTETLFTKGALTVEYSNIGTSFFSHFEKYFFINFSASDLLISPTTAR